MIVDGKPMLGAAGFAGEAGHMLINPAGVRCRCGAVGCWETEAGEIALLRRAGVSEGAGRLDEVVERAAAGDEPTLRAIAEIGRWLGLGIGNLINLFNPDLVVLGGLYQRLFTFLEPSVVEGAGRRTLLPPGDGDDRVQRPRCGRAAHRGRRAGAVPRDRRPRRRRSGGARRVTEGPPVARPSCGSSSGVAAGSCGARPRGAVAQRVRVERTRERGGPPHFVEEADAAGIHHVYDGDFKFFVGGGVAAFDCDDDGRPDLYFAGGTNPAALYRNESPVGGALRFAEVPDPVTDLTDVVGAYPIDIDGDGHIDLAVLRLGENVLLRGLGDCRFERGNEAWGFDGGDAWTAAFSAKWEGSATLPTLAFGNYLDLSRCRGTTTCADNELVRPEDGAAAYAAPIPLTPGWCTLSILFSDWDRSGRVDLRMTNDRHYYLDGEEQLWRVAAGEPPRLYTHDDGWQQLEIWGMGIASYDVTGDGLPEVFLTSQGDNKLQTLADGPARPNYRDIAIQAGVTAHRPYAGGDLLPSTAWHPEFQDVNNDGFIDLFISKGNVEAMPDFATKDPSNLLLGQPAGRSSRAARPPASRPSFVAEARPSSTSISTGCSTSFR